MKKKEFSLNKWHFRFGIVPIYWNNTILFHFGIFKLLSLPPEGEIITKENYKGFWFRKEFRFRGWQISF